MFARLLVYGVYHKISVPYSAFFVNPAKAQGCGETQGIRGAPPRTPPKTLLGKGLRNPQNLLIGQRDYLTLRISDCKKADVRAGESVLDPVRAADKRAGDQWSPAVKQPYFT